MSAFDTAWDLMKEYNPGWRHQARALPKLGDSDLTRISQQWLEDTGQTDPDYVGYEDYPSGQTMKYVLTHPDNPNFMVKKPRSTTSHYSQHRDPESLLTSRFGDEYYGKNLIEELEDLGFPIVSEYNVDNRYLLQPALNAHEPDTGRGRNNRPRMALADVALEHIIPDRVSGNWGVDQTGNWRMFDVDMGLSEPIDYWPFKDTESTPRVVGERLQEGLDKFGMQLPASRLLNFMSHIDHDRENMQRFLEAIEPHSDNPNYVTIDGKPEWREGY